MESMRTFAQIYQDILDKGIVSKFVTYHTLYIQALNNGHSTAGLNWELTNDEIVFLKGISHEITGVRVGNCGSCIADMIRNMYRWSMDYRARVVEPIQVSESKRTRKTNHNEG